jgi:hypothetical protein
MRSGSLQALKELLGHADLKMTLRYTHLSPDHLRSEVERGGTVGPSSSNRRATSPRRRRPDHVTPVVA